MDKILQVLSGSFIFKGICVEDMLHLLGSRFAVESFNTGDIIKAGSRKNLGVILGGSVTVTNADSGTILNTIEKGDAFGFATLFNDTLPQPRTLLTAGEKCEVLSISEQGLSEMMQEDIRITRNYIRHLSEKICFLNDKINGFVKYGARERLKEYIAQSMANITGNIDIRLDKSFKELSNILNIGRASLYRAFEEMEEAGIIEKNGKTIHIIKPEYFEMENIL